MAQVAATGRPVAAGQALRALDAQTGSRRTTDATVAAASPGSASRTLADGSAVRRTTTHTSGAGGAGGWQSTVRTELTHTSPDGVEVTTRAREATTKVGTSSAARTRSTTSLTTIGRYDEAGRRVVDPRTGEALQTPVSGSGRTSRAEVSGSGVSVGAERNAHRGAATASAGGKATVGADGLAGQATGTAGVGPLKGTGGGGVRFGPDGVEVNATGGVNLGLASASVRGSHQVNGGTTTDTTVMTLKLSTPSGKPVSGSMAYTQTGVRELARNDDGSTTYSVTGESRLALEGGVDVKQVAVDTSWTTGQRTVHTVTVPRGADVRAVDPTQPRSWATGTSVTISSEDYKGSTLGLSYARFGVEASSEVRDGRSIVFTKTQADTVNVQVGPTMGFTQGGKLKLDIAGGFGAQLGGTNTTDFTFFKTFDVAVATAGGQQVFAQTFTGRTAPTRDGNGVSDLREVTTGTWDYTSSMTIDTPFGAFGPESQQGSDTIWTRFGDGHLEYTRTYDANGDGRPELSVSASSRDGESFADKTFTFHTVVGSGVELSNARQLTARSTLAAGDRVDITVTAAELQELRHHENFAHVDPDETPDTAAYLQNVFAERISSGNGADVVMQTLFTLKNSPRAYDYTSPAPEIDLAKPLPGVVTVSP